MAKKKWPLVPVQTAFGVQMKPAPPVLTVTRLGQPLKQIATPLTQLVQLTTRKAGLAGLKEGKKEFIATRADPRKKHLQPWRIIQGQSLISAGFQATTSDVPGHPIAPHFSKLGPAGPINSRVIFELDVDDAVWQFLGIRPSGVKSQIHSMVIVPLIQSIINNIYDIVPSDSGDLRRAMARALTFSGGSRPDRFPYLIIMNTGGLEYAKPVNKMPTTSLAHSGQIRRGRVLMDPNAKKGFFESVVQSGRRLAEKSWKDFYMSWLKIRFENIVKMVGGRWWDYFRGFFSWRYN